VTRNMTSLGEVALFINGAAFKPEDWGDSGFPIIRIQNLTDESKPFNRTTRTVAEKLQVHPGDLLVSWSATLGVFTWNRSEIGLLNQHIFRVIPDESKVDKAYLRLALSGALSAMQKHLHGATMQHVNRGEFLGTPLYLPPLEEQRRIAAILDQAETLRTQRRTALALLDSLTQSLFLDMFGDPVANPKGWKKTPFGNVCPTRLGKMLDAKQQTGQNTRRYLRNANVQWFHIDVTDLLEMDFDADARETFRLQAGDLLICEGGEPGRAAIWNSELEDVYYQKALHRGRPNPTLAKAEFLVWLLWFLAKKGGLGDHVTAATIAHLTGEKLKAMEIPLPPLPLQQTFATRIASIEALKATHRRALAALDALFASLQQLAFSGELTLAAPRASAQSLEQLQQLEASIGQEALIFVAKRMPDDDLYNSLKAIYFADRHHLEHHGRQIYNETYSALDHGPVPQAAYDATKVLIGKLMFSSFDDDAMRAALRRNGGTLTALRDADFSKLSRAVIESLEWGIRYCRDMKFGQTKTASHDGAYERTPKNEAIPLQYIIDTLPPEARQRHWNL